MGIRIHKVIGYGVPNLNEVRELIDFKKLRTFLNKERELNSYLNFTKKNVEEILSLARGEWHPNVAEGVVRNVIFDLDMQRVDAKEEKDNYKNGWGSVYSHYNFNEVDTDEATAMIITPAVGYADWSRYDNIIDYMEASGDMSIQYVKVFNSGIFPFSGHFVKSDSENDLPSHVSYGQIKEEDKHLYRPYIPTVILSMLLWPGAFKVQELLKHIRPMVMTYWS